MRPGFGARVRARWALWGDLFGGVGLMVLGALILAVAIWGQVQRDQTNNRIQSSRVEAAKQVCLALGNTNRALIALLEASYRQALRNPRPGAPPPQEIRRLIDGFEKPLRTAGAAPPAQAEKACDIAAHRIVDLNK